MRALFCRSFASLGVLIHLVSAGAADLSVARRPEPAPEYKRAKTPLSFQDFGENDPACLAWTDDCRSCQRDADNTVSCSNVGIACQPSAIRCTAPAK
jgi:hypothetical protein